LPIDTDDPYVLRDELVKLQQNPFKCKPNSDIPKGISELIEWMLRYNEVDRISWDPLNDRIKDLLASNFVLVGS
jgi:hypothetical protein